MSAIINTGEVRGRGSKRLPSFASVPGSDSWWGICKVYVGGLEEIFWPGKLVLAHPVKILPGGNKIWVSRRPRPRWCHTWLSRQLNSAQKQKRKHLMLHLVFPSRVLLQYASGTKHGLVDKYRNFFPVLYPAKILPSFFTLILCQIPRLLWLFAGFLSLWCCVKLNHSSRRSILLIRVCGWQNFTAFSGWFMICRISQQSLSFQFSGNQGVFFIQRKTRPVNLCLSCVNQDFSGTLFGLKEKSYFI